MTQFSPPDTARLSRHARIAALASRFLAVALPSTVAMLWAAGTAKNAAIAGFGLPPDHTISAAQTLSAFALSVIPAAFVALGLIALASCFDAFAKGDWFGAAQPKALSRTGIWLVAAGISGLVLPTVIGLVVSLNAPVGERVLAISLSSDGVLAMLFGMAFWILGHLWSLARNIAAENAEFV